MKLACPLIATAFVLVLPQATRAQSDLDSRLREALRQTTIELRSLQDSQAALQAQLDQAKHDHDALQAQVQALQNAPPKPDPEVPQLRAAIAQLQQQNAALQAGLQKWQGAYQQAAQLAREKDSEGRQLAGQLEDEQTRFGACTTANTKLIAVANDILHLYHTQSFRMLLLGSYEPLLGLKRVELQNTIQDYEDKIMDQQYFPPPQPAVSR